jgi:hypothetical protein
MSIEKPEPRDDDPCEGGGVIPGTCVTICESWVEGLDQSVLKPYK